MRRGSFVVLLAVAALALAACGSRKPVTVTATGTGESSTGSAGAGGAGAAPPTGSAGADAVDAAGNVMADAAGVGPDAGADASGPPPGAFVLMSPASTPMQNGAPTFVWSASAGAATYELEVSTSETFEVARTMSRVGLTDTTNTWAFTFTPGQVLFWRVTAVGADSGRTVASNAPFWMSTPIAAGDGPHGVAATVTGKAIVADEVDGLTIVDLETLTTTRVPGIRASNVVAVSPDGARAFAAQFGGGRVSIVDVASAAVVDEIDSPCTDQFFSGLGLTPGGSLVMIDADASCLVPVLDVIPLGAPSMERRLPLAMIPEPNSIAVTPDGASALVPGPPIRRVDLTSGVATPIAMAAGMLAVAIEPDGKTAWTTEGEMGGVRSVDLTTNTAGDAIPFAPNSESCAIAISPVSRTAVVAGSSLNSENQGSLGVLDLAARKVVATYPFTARCVAITPDGKRALATSAESESLKTVMLYVIKLPP